MKTKNVANLVSISFVLAIFVLTGPGVNACSKVQLPEPPRSIVHPGMFILVGEVIGYTEPVSDPGNFRGEAVGLKLRLIESIHFPHYSNEYVELFMFGHGSDCFPEGVSHRPALGTRYRLALGKATNIANRSGSIVRLQGQVFSRISVDKPMFGYSTNERSEFDYKNDLPALIEKFKAPEMAAERRWLSDFLYIEASKDLIRLQKVRTETERLRILERLLYCPDINYRRLFFSEVGNPLRNEERDFLLMPTIQGITKTKPKKFSVRETELLEERYRLESLGELNVWSELR
ncbi:MAG: hypothetical protein IPM21_14015 [Acidobacteria bacterium]|nr:hypothetical protein [Acidobacteriota bacterium]